MIYLLIDLLIDFVIIDFLYPPTCKIAPERKGVRVKFSAKHLGMQVGSLCNDLIWSSAVQKYETRVQTARGTGAGLFAAVAEYNTMCITTLSYV